MDDPRQVQCPTCNAPPGSHCIGERGKPRAAHHAARVLGARPVEPQRPKIPEWTPTAQPGWCNCGRFDGIEVICDEHRRIGRSAIAQIRAERQRRNQGDAA